MSSPSLPDLDHPVEGPFWRAAAESRLEVQGCEACGYLRWPPAPICPECGVLGGRWEPIPPDGTIWSFTVYHRPLAPGLADEVPYAVGLIELDAGVRMIGRLSAPHESLAIGGRVSARFAPIGEGPRLPEWRPAEEHADAEAEGERA